ncbi:MAG: TrmH family RNA methyltransferase [Verrucomicrobiia bacterium]
MLNTDQSEFTSLVPTQLKLYGRLNLGLLFGNEGKGAPEEIHQWAGENRVTIPKYKDGLRSLNLAVSVGIATYEAIRQISP